jgi:hypothetical protein
MCRRKAHVNPQPDRDQLQRKFDAAVIHFLPQAVGIFICRVISTDGSKGRMGPRVSRSPWAGKGGTFASATAQAGRHGRTALAQDGPIVFVRFPRALGHVFRHALAGIPLSEADRPSAAVLVKAEDVKGFGRRPHVRRSSEHVGRRPKASREGNRVEGTSEHAARSIGISRQRVTRES